MEIVQFIEYKFNGIIYFIYIFFMIIFALACVGVVGEKKAKIKKEELIKKREEAAKQEYEKAQSLLDKQQTFSSLDRSLDPTANNGTQTVAASQSVPVPSATVAQAPVAEVSASNQNAPAA